MADWRDFEEGRRGLSLAGLADGESMAVYIDEEPYLNEEEIDQDDGSTETSQSLRVPCVPVDTPEGYTDMNDDEVEAIEEPESPDDIPENAPEYDIINSSTAFKKAMRNAYPGDVSAPNTVATITAHQPDANDNFGRTYSVDW